MMLLKIHQPLYEAPGRMSKIFSFLDKLRSSFVEKKSIESATIRRKLQLSGPLQWREEKHIGTCYSNDFLFKSRKDISRISIL